MPTTIDERVSHRLNSDYFAAARRSWPTNLISNALFLSFFYWRYQEWQVAALGVVAVLAVAARVASGVAYQRLHARYPSPELWERVAVGVVLASFLALAPAAMWILVRPGEHLNNGVFVLWYLLAASVTLMQNVSMPGAMYAIGGVITMSLVGRMLLVGGPEYVFGAVAICLFVMLQLASGLSMHRLQRSALKQSYINEQLAQDLQRQVEAASAASRAALIASEEKSRFIAAATHDLRQPLQALMFTVAALTPKLRGSPSEPEIEHAMTCAGILGDSLDTMLDLSKLDAGATSSRPRSVPIDTLFAQLQQTFIERANSKGIALRVRAGAGLWVWADQELLLRLMSNLVDNAVKYTASGGVLVTARRRGEDVLIEVRDSGIGIPPEFQEKVFDEFFQVDNPGRERSQGLGLGLSIVKRLADLMGIRLELQSERGRGTVFRIRCKQAQPTSDEQASISVPGANGPGDDKLLQGQRVLVVDNEADIVRGITNVLEGAGAGVTSAMSAAQALACMDASNRFDVAILDYRLGGAITGIELAGSLQQKQPGLPTLILTGDTHAAEIQALRQSHIPVLFKPVRPAELLQLTLQATEAQQKSLLQVL